MKHTKEYLDIEKEKRKTTTYNKNLEKADPMEQSAQLYKNSMPKEPPKGGKLRFAPTVVFAVFIFAMAIWFVINPKADYSSSEKRYLQKFPTTNFETVSSGKFGEEFENYFADHFPARNMWVGFNAYYTLCTGNNGAGGVYLCKDGYLINEPVTTENNLKKNIGAIVDFKNKVDADITVMLAPSTGYIADDVLPPVHNFYNDDEYFNNAKRTLNNSGIDFCDLRETFKNEYKNGTQLYYKTDHHWNTAGAYTAYAKLCSQLGIEPISKSALNTETYKGFYGTTYSTSGFWLTDPDTIQVWSNPENGSNIRVKIAEGNNSEEYGSMYFYNHLDEDDKYPVFLDGNHALTEITNTNAEGGTILLIKDSFSHSLAPFLAENYSKVIMVDMRYYKQDVSEIVKAENPEEVIVLYGIDNLATDTDLVWLK